jgi:hypothetical protein
VAFVFGVGDDPVITYGTVVQFHKNSRANLERAEFIRTGPGSRQHTFNALDMAICVNTEDTSQFTRLLVKRKWDSRDVYTVVQKNCVVRIIYVPAT